MLRAAHDAGLTTEQFFEMTPLNAMLRFGRTYIFGEEDGMSIVVKEDDYF